MSEFNQSKYINKFIKEKYDTFKVQVPKGEKMNIEEYRKAKGYKSLNSYIVDLIRKDMEEGKDQEGAKTYGGGVLRIIEKLFRKFTPSASCCRVSCLNIKKYIDFEMCICYNPVEQQ